ncbi:DUF2057 family protein [Vibrio taketomensis]|uniref:DUF2057 family protein n=1 Tax=Vibrio taketomensis TaxID=2572923 RepID=UPI001389E5B1|nr:DUF2057 family protein [Vibrio taketomensis]
MKIKHLLAVLAGALALPLQAAVLTAQDGVSILYINGQAAQEKIGKNQVEDGFIQAVVRFDDKLGSGNSGKVYTSKPYLLSFDAQGEAINIVAPQVYSEQEADIEFAKAKPNWKIVVDGKDIAFEQSQLKGKSGFMPYAGMENLIAEHNKQNGIYFKDGQLVDAPAALEVAVVPAAVAKAENKPAVKAAPADVKNVEQLKAWYLKASKEERKEFRRWMIDQE